MKHASFKVDMDSFNEYVRQQRSKDALNSGDFPTKKERLVRNGIGLSSYTNAQNSGEISILLMKRRLDAGIPQEAILGKYLDLYT